MNKEYDISYIQAEYFWSLYKILEPHYKEQAKVTDELVRAANKSFNKFYIKK